MRGTAACSATTSAQATLDANVGDLVEWWLAATETVCSDSQGHFITQLRQMLLVTNDTEVTNTATELRVSECQRFP